MRVAVVGEAAVDDGEANASVPARDEYAADHVRRGGPLGPCVSVPLFASRAAGKESKRAVPEFISTFRSKAEKES